MEHDPNTANSFIYSLSVALVGSGTGRIVWHFMEVQSGKRKLIGLAILLQLAIAGMMALLAIAIADAAGWSDKVLAGLSALMGYLGPKGVEFWAKYYLEARRIRAGGKTGGTDGD